jgi:hypothetical protein
VQETDLILFTGDGKLKSSCNLESFFFFLCFTIVLHFIVGAWCQRQVTFAFLDLAFP